MSKKPGSKRYFKVGFATILGVAFTAYITYQAEQKGASFSDAWALFFTGAGFWCVYVAFLLSVNDSNRAKREAAEAMYLQALANQMSAYAVLAEHCGDQVLCGNFRQKLMDMSKEFDEAKLRCEKKLKDSLEA